MIGHRHLRRRPGPARTHRSRTAPVPHPKVRWPRAGLPATARDAHRRPARACGATATGAPGRSRMGHPLTSRRARRTPSGNMCFIPRVRSVARPECRGAVIAAAATGVPGPLSTPDTTGSGTITNRAKTARHSLTATPPEHRATGPRPTTRASAGHHRSIPAARQNGRVIAIPDDLAAAAGNCADNCRNTSRKAPERGPAGHPGGRYGRARIRTPTHRRTGRRATRGAPRPHRAAAAAGTSTIVLIIALTSTITGTLGAVERQRSGSSSRPGTARHRPVRTASQRSVTQSTGPGRGSGLTIRSHPRRVRDLSPE